MVMVLLGLHALGILAPVERVVVATLRPIQYQVSGWFLETNPSSSEDSSMVRTLEDQVLRLEIDNARLQEALSRAEIIHQTASALDARSLKNVMASVIGRSPEGDEQVIILDRGTESKIQLGQPVIALDGVLVGLILKAEAGRSVVRLLTSAQSTVAAEAQNTTRSPGVVTGQHGLSMIMRFIPQGENLKKGNMIVTSSVNEHIPAGLIIGKISEVHFSTGDLFQQASLSPILDSQRVRFVAVVQTP